MSVLVAADWVCIGVYFAGVALVGGWSYWKRRATTSAESYFLAGRSMGWIPVGLSLFVSNIGSEHLVGLACQPRVESRPYQLISRRLVIRYPGSK